MPNELTKSYLEYKQEIISDNCRLDILKQLRNKLLMIITDENINQVVDEECGDTLLHAALFNKDLKLTQWLLEHNAKIDIPDKFGLTPMRMATTALFFEGIKLLQLKGADVDEVDSVGETALFTVVRSGNYDGVKGLLELNANIHASEKYGETIIDCIAHLLNNNNMVNIADKYKVIRLLLENYIGIGTSWDGINLPPEVLNDVPMIFATKDKKLISKQMPGFEGVIDSISELLQSKTLNFKKLQIVLEKAFSPFFPNDNPLLEISRRILKENGRIRETHFEAAGPELEKLYKTLRIRTAGVSSLRDLASTALMIKHGLKAEKAPQLTADAKSTPLTETQKLTENENNNKSVQSSDAALLIKQGLHAEKIPVDTIKSISPAETQNLTDNQAVQPTEKMKLVADAILDPQKLALMPPDLVEYIEKLGNEIQEKLGHNDPAKKIETK